jgi:hypothetical protein
MEWFVTHGQHLWSDDHYPLFANSLKVLSYTLLCSSDWHNVSSFFLACSLALTAPVQAAFEPKNRPYDVEHYRIEIHLDIATDKYETLTTIRFKPTANLNRITLDANGIEVKGAKFDAVSLVVTTDPKQVFPCNDQPADKATQHKKPSVVAENGVF